MSRFDESAPSPASSPTSRRLEGKVAIVTGASRGIGRSAALALAREGARVVIAAKSETERGALPGTIHATAGEIRAAGGEALAIRCDVRVDDDLEALVRQTRERFGRIDILVHNAGALWWTDLADTPIRRIDLVFDVNVRAALVLTRLALPDLVAAGGGHVVVLSPPIELDALAGHVPYMISKFGMTMMAIGLGEELRPHGIAVNALWPATAIETAATINFAVGGRSDWRTPEIVADAIVEIVVSKSADLTGQVLIDEDFLRTRGWSDFTKYRSDPAHEPPRFGLRDLPRAGKVKPRKE